MNRLPTSTRTAFLSLLAAGVLVRAMIWPAVGGEQLTPDGARFFNIARCIERGQGFATPEAWPAWMNPDELPMPETFKEPGYPYAIAALSRPAGSPFRAAKAISFLAGVLIPLLVWSFSRRLGAAPLESLVAGLLTAFSPLLAQLSVAAMAESLFVALLFGAFLFAATARSERRHSGATDTGAAPRAQAAMWRAGLTREIRSAAAAGAFLGAAYLVRAQALLAVPAFMLLLTSGHSRRVALVRVCVAPSIGLLVASPFLLRNLSLFGAPFYSDAAAFGVWPYVDQLAFSSMIERPPAPMPFAMSHMQEVLAHIIASARTFVRWTIGGDMLPGIIWLVPFAIGFAVTAARWRRWAVVWLLVACSLPFLWAVYWAPRYFAMLVPAFALIGAVGVVWVDRNLTKRLPRASGLIALTGVLLSGAIALPGIHHRARKAYTPDAAAARAQAPFLKQRLAPDEAVMCDITSYWAWYADRPAVHIILADDVRLTAILRRLKVRYAVLSDEKAAAYASRYPRGRLPTLFVPHHHDDAHGVTLYEIVLDRAPNEIRP